MALNYTFSYGRRNLDAEHHWEDIDLENYQVSKPVVLMLGGDGTKNNKKANGYLKTAEKILGVFKDDVDIVGVSYNDALRSSQTQFVQTYSLVENLFIPLVSADGEKLSTEQACKNMRNISILAHCCGDFKISECIENILEDRLSELGYNDEDRDKILSQIFMVSFASPYKKEARKFKTFSVLSATDDTWLETERDWDDLKKNPNVKISKEDREEIESLPRFSDGEVMYFKFYDTHNRCFILKNENAIRVATANLNVPDYDLNDHYFTVLERDKEWNRYEFASATGDFTSRCVSCALCFSVANSILNQQYEELLPIIMDDLQANLENVVSILNEDKKDYTIKL